MLIGYHFLYPELHILFKRRKFGFFFLIGIIAALYIKYCISVKINSVTGGFEYIAGGIYISLCCLMDTFSHLTCDKTLPYKLIKLVLVVCKAVLYLRWFKVYRCRSYCFVSVLCI